MNFVWNKQHHSPFSWQFVWLQIFISNAFKIILPAATDVVSAAWSLILEMAWKWEVLSGKLVCWVVSRRRFLLSHFLKSCESSRVLGLSAQLSKKSRKETFRICVDRVVLLFAQWAAEPARESPTPKPSSFEHTIEFNFPKKISIRTMVILFTFLFN